MKELSGGASPATLTTTADTTTASEAQAKCDSFTHVMRILGKRWTGLVLRELMAGPRRYNEMLTAIPGLSDPLLTQRLRELEAEGLVERRVIPSQPVRIEYLLTTAGCDLAEPLRVLEAWGDRWLTAR
jgi:DNA-binding HxlR family transcriptional regulator